MAIVFRTDSLTRRKSPKFIKTNLYNVDTYTLYTLSGDEETCIIQMFENEKKIIAILNHRMASDTDYIGLAQNALFVIVSFKWHVHYF